MSRHRNLALPRPIEVRRRNGRYGLAIGRAKALPDLPHIRPASKPRIPRRRREQRRPGSCRWLRFAARFATTKLNRYQKGQDPSRNGGARKPSAINHRCGSRIVTSKFQKMPLTTTLRSMPQSRIANVSGNVQLVKKHRALRRSSRDCYDPMQRPHWTPQSRLFAAFKRGGNP